MPVACNILMEKRFVLITRNSLSIKSSEFIEWHVLETCWNLFRFTYKRIATYKYVHIHLFGTLALLWLLCKWIRVRSVYMCIHELSTKAIVILTLIQIMHIINAFMSINNPTKLENSIWFDHNVRKQKWQLNVPKLTQTKQMNLQYCNFKWNNNCS